MYSVSSVDPKCTRASCICPRRMTAWNSASTCCRDLGAVHQAVSSLRVIVQIGMAVAAIGLLKRLVWHARGIAAPAVEVEARFGAARTNRRRRGNWRDAGTSSMKILADRQASVRCPDTPRRSLQPMIRPLLAHLWTGREAPDASNAAQHIVTWSTGLTTWHAGRSAGIGQSPQGARMRSAVRSGVWCAECRHAPAP
jgi:hypothetical protein